MNELAVVIPHFFEERTANLTRIVETLERSSYPVDEIIVWNNATRTVQYPSSVLMIYCPKNIGPQGRFLGAMVSRCKRILFLDNDTAVNEGTIANLVGWQTALGGVVTCEGREGISGARYSSWPKFYGHGLPAPKKVFHTLGRGELIERTLLNEVIGDFPFGPEAQMDDLLFSDALARHQVPVHVVPCVRGTSDLVDLPMGGKGMCKEPDYQERRNAVIQTLGGLS